MLGFIVNPASGNGKGAIVWEQVQAEITALGMPFNYKMTQRRGETILLAQELLQDDDVDTLVAIGGDGTIHEAANALYQSGKTGTVKLAAIAGGTGNDFAREHRIPEDPSQALRLIAHERNGGEWIDLFEMNGKIAINCLGVGFDAVVAKNANKAFYKKALNVIKLGKVSYFISAIKAFLTFQPFTAVIQSGESEQRFSSVWMVVVSNIPYFGGGMKVSPHAVCNDGEAEAIVFHSGSRLGLVSIFGSIYSGSHLNNPAVTVLKGSRIRIATDRSQQMQADGEPFDSPVFDLLVLPRALFVVKPVE
jgi:diacylglycerol kinase (ATP)